MIIDVVKVLMPSTVAFVIGVGITPLVAYYLYKYKLWKKKSVEKSIDGREALISASLHRDEEKKTPRMGGVVIWLSVILTALFFWMADQIIGSDLFSKLDFVSRNQTWIPLAALLVGALFGLLDDFLGTQGGQGGGGYIGGGLSLTKRLLVVSLIALSCALWFYFKLDVSSIGFPIFGEIYIGILIIPLFILVALGLYSGGVIDGIDGLAGGIFASMFAAYGIIAFYQHQIDLASFCATVVGATLAFLWFNIPPARFYMSETGTMGLTVTLAVVAFMTDALGDGHGLLALPVIAMPLIITTLSVIIQLMSKKIRGKKVFLVAPLHHHFEALGWPGYKVTMRFWIVGIVFASLGVVFALIG